MKSYFKNLKEANFDVIYNIYNLYTSNYIIEIIFIIIQVMQNLGMTLCDKVSYILIKLVSSNLERRKTL